MSAGGTGALIEQLWRQFGPLVEARITTIEELVAACRDPQESTPARERTLEALRTRAREATHSLIGSLGSYGRPNGSTVASAIDVELDRAVIDVEAVTRLVRALRAAVAL